MNPRTTGLLLVAALGLFAFVYFYELGGEDARLDAEERGRRLFSDVEAEDITWIALTTSDGVDARFERSEGEWRLVSPLDHAADPAVERMADTLATVTHEATLEQPGSDAEYGLADDARVVHFGTGEVEHTLRLGRDTPVGSNVYAKADAGEAVYTVASYRKAAFDRGLSDLREKRILDFDTSAVREVEVRWPDGHVMVERVTAASRPSEVSEAEDAEEQPEEVWRMRAPVAAAADTDAIESLLSTLSFLRADDFIDEPTPEQTALLSPPAFAVTLSGADSGQGPIRLSVGRAGEGERRPVRAGVDHPLYWIAAERIEDFPRRTAAYRDRTLARVEPGSVRQIDFFFRSAEGERAVVRATRDESGAWSSEPEPFAEGKLARIVSELADLEAVDVLAESMGEAELEGVGLSPPTTIVTVLGAAPEPEEGDEGGLPPEAPVLAELHFGAVTADGVVARRAGEDPIYRLDLPIAEVLPVSFEAFHNRFRAEESEAASAAMDTGDELIEPDEESP